MPRINGVMELLPGTYGIAGQPVQSVPYNLQLDDFVNEMNSLRPITAGGTGAGTAIGAHDNFVTRGSDIASAATLNLNNATGGFVDITGTTTVTAVTLTNGRTRYARAAGAFQITASASLIVNGSTSVNYTTQAGDLLRFVAYGSNVVRVWVVGGLGLGAFAGLSSTGVLVQTANNVYAARTITGTANEVAVTNGNGVSGNPALSLPSSLTFTGKTVTGGTFSGATLSGNTALPGTGIIDSSGNIGLGTTSPQTKLHVAGEITAASANAFRAANSTYGSFIRNDNNNTYWMLTASGDPFGSFNGLRPLAINNATGDTTIANAVYAVHGGNVGIGASSPAEKLHVAGNAYVTGTIEMGHASDTTLSRLGAGRLGVEGVEVATASNSLTMTGKTFTSAVLNTGVSGTAVASQSQMEAGSSTTTIVSPGRQHFHPSAAKGWVSFNGTGTVAVLSSYNVASVSDNGTGSYTVNWDVDFSSANYSAIAASSADVTRSSASQTAGGQPILTFTLAGAANDPSLVCVAAYGDQ